MPTDPYATAKSRLNCLHKFAWVVIFEGFILLLLPSLLSLFDTLEGLRRIEPLFLGTLSIALPIVMLVILRSVAFFGNYVRKEGKDTRLRKWLVRFVYRTNLRIIVVHSVCIIVIGLIIYLIGYFVVLAVDRIPKAGVDAVDQYPSFLHVLTAILWILPMVSIPLMQLIWQSVSQLETELKSNKPIEKMIADLQKIGKQAQHFQMHNLPAKAKRHPASRLANFADTEVLFTSLDEVQKEYQTHLDAVRARLQRQTAIVTTVVALITSIGPLKSMRPENFPQLATASKSEMLARAFEDMNIISAQENDRPNWPGTKLAALGTLDLMPEIRGSGDIETQCDFEGLLRANRALGDEELSARILACQLIATRTIVASEKLAKYAEGQALTYYHTPLAELERRIAEYERKFTELHNDVSEGAVLPVHIKIFSADEIAPEELLKYADIASPVTVQTYLDVQEKPFVGKDSALVATLNGSQEGEPVELPVVGRIVELISDPIEVDVKAKLGNSTELRQKVANLLLDSFTTHVSEHHVGPNEKLPDECKHFGDIKFDLNSSEPLPVNRRKANSQVIEALELKLTQETSNVFLIGYADLIGNAVKNIQLAERRARKTKQILSDAFPADLNDKIEISFMGAKEPALVAKGNVFRPRSSEEDRKVAILICPSIKEPQKGP